MGQDSKQYTLMFPLSLSEALERRAGAGKMDFIRAAVAEKLARDFGENLSPTLSRANQGKRNDLDHVRAARAVEIAGFKYGVSSDFAEKAAEKHVAEYQDAETLAAMIAAEWHGRAVIV